MKELINLKSVVLVFFSHCDKVFYLVDSELQKVEVEKLAFVFLFFFFLAARTVASFLVFK